MKAFWAIVVVLVLVVAGLVFLRGQSGGPPPSPSSTSSKAPAPESPRVTAPETPAPAKPAPAAEPDQAVADSTATPVSSPAAAGTSIDDGVRPVPAPVTPSGVSPKPVDPARAEASTPAPTKTAAKPLSPEDELALNAMAVEMIRDFDTALDLRNPTGLPVSVTPPAPGTAAAGAAAAPLPPLDPNAKAKLTPRNDGTVLVDDRFVIKGKGDKADPYVVTWEMLVSAQETYQPRLGRKLIPDRLKMIDGKWVRIPGFIAFPIMAQTQDEMLMMLNQWDGCCIGVPPTPYDAIEVKLSEAAKGDDRLRVSGTVTGILRVDPYLVKDWLVSLYLMDDAILTIEANAAKREPSMMEGHQAQ